MEQVIPPQKNTAQSKNGSRHSARRGGGAPRGFGASAHAGAQTGGNRERRSRSALRRERVRAEFDQKVVSIRRVTRVVAGGRRFSFSVAMVLGDKKGSVGVGIGKAGDTALAIEKAMKDAKRNMITVRMTETMSIPHPVRAKYASSHVVMHPAPGGGLVAGSSVRNVLQLAGITDVSAKIHSRSRNHLNNARVAIEALRQIRGTVMKECV